jgi:hypothetical protein
VQYPYSGTGACVRYCGCCFPIGNGGNSHTSDIVTPIDGIDGTATFDATNEIVHVVLNNVIIDNPYGEITISADVGNGDYTGYTQIASNIVGTLDVMIDVYAPEGSNYNTEPIKITLKYSTPDGECGYDAIRYIIDF